jgi:membrane-bound lytic murein transglycosylase B
MKVIIFIICFLSSPAFASVAHNQDLENDSFFYSEYKTKQVDKIRKERDIEVQRFLDAFRKVKKIDAVIRKARTTGVPKVRTPAN